MNNENKWLDDNNIKTIDQYLNTADVILIERNRFIKILIDLFSYSFNEKSNLHLLDLGCGDGVITKKIFELFPQNHFYLMDGSKNILDKAKEQLSGDNFNFLNCKEHWRKIYMRQQ